MAAILTAAVLASSALASDGGADAGIVGGETTTIEEWPWQVAIADPPDGRNGYRRQFCGGTLVTPTAVVTAAHCVYSGGFDPPSAFSVITGRTTLSSDDGAEISVTDVIYLVNVGGVATPQSQTQPPAGPELYDDNTSEWDVAVLELASPAPAPAAPIQIAAPGERGIWGSGDPAFATGWGDTTGLQDYADELQEVELKVISDVDCGDATSYGSDFKPDTMVCAGTPPTGGKDTCQGDSGGPLVAPTGTGAFRLVGVTSFGTGCALPEKWGVYARVADVTMRSAVREAAGLPADDPPPPPPPDPVADRTAPRTAFDSVPRKRSRSRKARFKWTASEQSTFTCRLDRKPPRSCSSPFVRRVRRVRGGRRHIFTVVAADAAGNVEPKGLTYSWKVKKPKRR